MIASMKKWSIERPDEELVKSFSEALNMPSMHAKILASRGIKTVDEAKAFIQVDESALHDPFLLYQMDEAVERIKAAISDNKKIVVYGDYDAGATRF